MQPDALDDQIPIQRLGAGSAIVREVATTGRPKVVTEDGVQVAVILDTATFDELRGNMAAHGLLQDLQWALAEANNGELVDHDDVMSDVRERLQGKVSSEVLRQLGSR